MVQSDINIDNSSSKPIRHHRRVTIKNYEALSSIGKDKVLLPINKYETLLDINKDETLPPMHTSALALRTLTFASIQTQAQGAGSSALLQNHVEQPIPCMP